MENILTWYPVIEIAPVNLYNLTAGGINQTAPMDEDIALVQSFKSGNRSSFEEIMKKYKDRIFRISCSMVQDAAEADDVTQVTFLRAYEHIGSFREESTFFTWLCGIAVNECRHALRRQRRMPVSLDESIQKDDEMKLSDLLKSNEESAESRLIREEQVALMNRIINTLPEKYRIVYILKNVDGLSYMEISSVMDISMAKVKVWLFRAREKMDEKMRTLFKEQASGGDRL
jgi:RNA polymerase sigma-70 factor (ECF subfamily)